MIKNTDQDEKTLLKSEFAEAVRIGLTASPKVIPSRFFYDERGSELFDKITNLPEYYLTRAELENLKNNADLIASHLQNFDAEIYELGAGNGEKAEIILKAVQKVASCTFYPVDISMSALETLRNRLAPLGIEQKLLHTTFDRLPAIIREQALNRKREKQYRRMVVFLGSNIGNLSLPAAQTFLATIYSALEKNDLLLLGFDLKKDIPTMVNAYSDSQNVTRDFNLNLLSRMNRELGANFDTEKFMHYAYYNPHLGAMESHLVAREACEIHLAELNLQVQFKEWESIRTEYSHKYNVSEMCGLANSAGLLEVATFFDSKKRFCNILFKAGEPV
ncbi:MAG: L-histidine N(alpha)-methyltransferase [Leptospiraceae bacterium]|nr:L-histidine N(alpha)-methyltransferase [Leptospiraceae bacterium]